MKNRNGFSLLEALIALLVITVGLLGIAGLQAASVYRTHVGEINSLAAVEAQSIAAAMIANPGAFPANGADSDYNTTNAAAVAPPSPPCTTAACTPAGMANYDLHQWGTELAQDLPQGKGAIACGFSPAQCTVTISWQEKQMAASAGNSTGTIKNRRYSIVVRP
ncbi:MAG: type IV pilus modification protein PilV [Gammaproteobacteria bacterium]